MDVTMSSYSFSHQFSQHWTGAPKPVRAAIVQELTDITDLLQSDTPYEDFEFSIHDLDAHLDDLYAAHQVQQAEQQRLADEQAQTERKAREKQQKEEEAEQAAKAKEAQAKATREKQAAQLAADNAKNSAATESGDTQKPDNSAATTTAQKEQTTQKSDSTSQDDAQHHHNPEHSDTTHSDTKHSDNGEATPITSALSAAIDLSLSDPALTATHKELIQELEATIDDYLTEQMLQMSESLKSWLRTEVSRQLSEQNTANAAATRDEPRPKT